MNYKCEDNFLFRIPKHPLEFQSLIEMNIDDLVYFVSQMKLDELIYTSSPSLFKSMKNGNTMQVNRSILKYLLRSWCRATPYGELAGVGIGCFGIHNECLIRKNNALRFARPDMEWLISAVSRIEIEKGDDLVVYPNNTVRIVGNSLVNGWMSCYYHDRSFSVGETIVSYNEALKQVYLMAAKGVSLKDLIETLYIQFGTDKKMIRRSLYYLLKKEFLISEYRLSLFDASPLKSVTEGKYGALDTRYRIFEKLKEIQALFNFINRKDDNSELQLLTKVEDKMQSIVPSSKYLNIDLFYNDKLILENKMKDSIEHYCRFLESFAVKCNQNVNFTSLFNETFSESYIKVVELADILPELSSVMTSFSESIVSNENLKSLKRYCLENINSSILDLARFDWKEFNNKRIRSFECVFQIAQKDGEISYIVPNFFGSESSYQAVGKYFYYFDSLKRCYENNVDSGIASIELSFVPKLKNASNVMLVDTPYNYTLTYASRENLSKEKVSISLDDIYVSVIDGEICFFSKKLESQVEFVMCNKISPLFMPPIIKFLIYGTQSNYDSAFSLYDEIEKIQSTCMHLPRIIYNQFIISPEMWRIEYTEEFTSNINDFRKYIWDKISTDHIVYEDDERMYIDLRSEPQLEILYSTLKKKLSLKVYEAINYEYSPLTVNECGEHYLAEFVFQITTSSKRTAHPFITKRILSNDVINSNTFLPMNKWLYIKFFTKKYYENTILIKYLLPFLNKLKSESLIYGYFYVRYIENGVNTVRLRMMLAEGAEQKVLQSILEIQSLLQNESIISKSIIDTYQREVMRYGGESLYPLAESIFCEDSYAVLHCINNPSYYSTMEYAVLLICTMLIGAGFSIMEQIELLNEIRIKTKDDREYREIRKKLFKHIYDYIYSPVDNERIKGIENISLRDPSLNKYYMGLIGDGCEKTTIKNIFHSLLHMSMNRLVGIDRDFENRAYTYAYHLMRSIEGYKKYTKS